MAQNSRSEGAVYPIDPNLQSDEVPATVKMSRPEMAPLPTASQEREDRDRPTTVTTTTSHGVPDFIPTLIPALQSSAYVLVILGGFLAWSSRKLAVDFCEKHITLVETLKVNLDTQLVTAKDQLELLKQLAANNEKLVDTVANIAERNSVPRSQKTEQPNN